MPELLLELFSEEIPARFQRRAAGNLKKAVTDALVESGLSYESAAGFATPRRLALSVTGIAARSPDTSVEKKGPRVGAPDKAVAGFLRGAGLSRIEEAQIHTEPKKGRFYVAVIQKKGADARTILAKILPDRGDKFLPLGQADALGHGARALGAPFTGHHRHFWHRRRRAGSYPV